MPNTENMVCVAYCRDCKGWTKQWLDLYRLCGEGDEARRKGHRVEFMSVGAAGRLAKTKDSTCDCPRYGETEGEG